ncbi:hypothetical protein GYMLUDRAFT_48745 [Collybiopsis luxurians FD-317 M1]|uniref:RPW8 domain-containing protein n=1 Tax=Collybiopsis luxurians FD-317 M1 TaxID=944289 RepID=A0A0D0BX82_9AGAR|nr:hypothetical protein GYMLUDRAFT_48745 [Collybiopsis luxurians FD-317 M1]
MSGIGEASLAFGAFGVVNILYDKIRPAVAKKLPFRMLSDGRKILQSEENLRRFTRIVQLAPEVAKSLQDDRDQINQRLEAVTSRCQAGKARWNFKVRLELFHAAKGMLKVIQVYEQNLHEASAMVEEEANRKSLSSVPSIENSDWKSLLSRPSTPPDVGKTQQSFYNQPGNSLTSLFDVDLQKILIEQYIADSNENGVSVPSDIKCRVVGELNMETEDSVLCATVSGAVNPGGISINDEVEVTVQPQGSPESVNQT